MALPSLVAYAGGDDGDSDSENTPKSGSARSNRSDSFVGSPPPIKVGRKESDIWGEDDDAFNVGGIKEKFTPDSARASSSWDFNKKPQAAPSINQRGEPIIGNAMPKVSSLLSLADYHGEEDSFTRYDKEHADEDMRTGSTQSSSAGSDYSRNSDERREPRPPARKSDDEDLVECLLAAGEQAITQGYQTDDGSASPMPTNTQEQVDSPKYEQPDEPIELPSDAEGEADPEVEAKFAQLFERKAEGFNINQKLFNNRTFTNPSGYVIIKEKFRINELGTNFRKDIYDPSIFPEDCFYDKLAEAQNRLMDPDAAGGSGKKKKS
ncbi:unnamed protein product, partial [Mesorhabditis spiculigera]